MGRCLPAQRGAHSSTDILFAPIDSTALDRPQHTRIPLNATGGREQARGHARAASGVEVIYAINGAFARVRGKALIVAAGGGITHHIVRDLLPDPSKPAMPTLYGGVPPRGRPQRAAE